MTDASFPCVQCGSPVPRSAQFCTVCGTPVSSRTQAVALGGGAAGSGSGATGAAGVGGAGGAAGPGGSAAWRPTPAVPEIRRGDIIPSTYGRRVAAFLIDAVIGVAFWLLVTMPLIGLGAIVVRSSESSFSVSGLSAVLLIVPALVYPLVKLLLQSFLGFSLGKLMLGLRIVNVQRLGRPGLGWMLLRELFIAAASLVFFIGQCIVYLSPLWDSERIGRGWHDRLARTWVIDVKAGPNPLKARPGQLVLDEPARDAGADEPAGFGGGRAFTPGSAASATAAQRAATPAPPASAPGTPTWTGPRPPAPSAGVPVAPHPSSPTPAPAPTAAPAPPAAPIDRVPGFDPRPPVIAAVAVPADDEGDDADSTRLSQPRDGGGASGIVFRLDSGERIPISRHGVLGRDPVSPGGDLSDIVIPLAGDTLSVSKTHLEFGVDADGVWVSDRGSTNGTAIVRGDGAELAIDPGERIPVEAGDRIRVGTRFITVETGA